MRKFLSLLFGSATVVGFETTFGFSNWRPIQFNKPRSVISRDQISLLPGGITYVTNFRELRPLGNGAIDQLDDWVLMRSLCASMNTTHLN